MKPAQDILPHSEFKQIHPRLWTLEGKLPHHIPLPRTMTVFKMNDGALWIHSAIALNDETQKVLESFGKPKYVVVPNPDHRLDAHFYKETYPDIKIVAPEAAIKKVEEVISVDASCEDEFRNTEIEVIAMPGAKLTELAYEIQLGDQLALVMTDLLINVPKVKGVGGFLLKALGRIGFFRSPPVSKLRFLEKRKAFRNWLLAESNKAELKIVTMAHGAAVTQGVSDLLKRAAFQV